MNILVTGGAGFLGSHLCERLIAEEVGPEARSAARTQERKLAGFYHLLAELLERRDQMETWSQLCLTLLTASAPADTA